ncbi:MAG: dihydrodipicolinate synthase family protein [Mycobacterium sp.]
MVAGIYPAVMTAYNNRGDVDLDATLNLVERLLGAGVHGLFIGGTAGEGPIQSVDERASLVTAITDHVAGRIPILAHVGAMPFRDTVLLARKALDEGVAGVAAIPPLYYNVNADAVADYFRALSRELGRPVMAYHVPHLTHRPAAAPWFAQLAAEGVLDGVKYSADDLADIQDLIERTSGTDFQLLSGSDPLCMAARLAGSAGAVGVSINAMPATFVALWNAVDAGDLAEAARLQAVITRFVTRMFNYDFIGYLRHVLSLQGVPVGQNRPPLPRLTGEQEDEITRFVSGDPDLATAFGLS